ncbi:hypothetical protein Ccrd_013437 [Cynara cardunculus var. scolymus]|uniref:Uncharacterized protein n=1 Tax=Cynara cardunculus var. scolymus TaxID=59895 RepID=A0A103YFL3_CYNCS|nr:hypothetical protein Ccrd_013437 [Cynara cardunculus var. scolymus]
MSREKSYITLKSVDWTQVQRFYTLVEHRRNQRGNKFYVVSLRSGGKIKYQNTSEDLEYVESETLGTLWIYIQGYADNDVDDGYDDQITRRHVEDNLSKGLEFWSWQKFI